MSGGSQGFIVGQQPRLGTAIIVGRDAEQRICAQSRSGLRRFRRPAGIVSAGSGNQNGFPAADPHAVGNQRIQLRGLQRCRLPRGSANDQSLYPRFFLAFQQSVKGRVVYAVGGEGRHKSGTGPAKDRFFHGAFPH